jgi:hypothetical protein
VASFTISAPVSADMPDVIFFDDQSDRSPTPVVAAVAVTGSPSGVDLRLSSSSSNPGLISSATAFTTLYLVSYCGEEINLWNGSVWDNIVLNGTPSITLTGLATASRMYDIFATITLGVPAIEAVAWTNNTTRATAITWQDGRLCKSGAKTRRYMGSILLDAAKRCVCFYGGSSASTQGEWGLYNHFNQLQTVVHMHEATTNFNDAAGGSGDWQAVDADANNRVDVTAGVGWNPTFARGTLRTDDGGGIGDFFSVAIGNGAVGTALQEHTAQCENNSGEGGDLTASIAGRGSINATISGASWLTHHTGPRSNHLSMKDGGSESATAYGKSSGHQTGITQTFLA